MNPIDEKVQLHTDMGWFVARIVYVGRKSPRLKTLTANAALSSGWG